MHDVVLRCHTWLLESLGPFAWTLTFWNDWNEALDGVD